MCQCVIELYLIDQGSSLLITVPSAFGILVQLWKVHKATKPDVITHVENSDDALVCDGELLFNKLSELDSHRSRYIDFLCCHISNSGCHIRTSRRGFMY